MVEKLNSAEKSHGANFLKIEKDIIRQFLTSRKYVCKYCGHARKVSNDRMKCGLRSNQFDEWQPVYVKADDYCSEFVRSVL